MAKYTESELRRGYVITDWKGYPNFQCVFCPYATLDIQHALGHLAERHGFGQTMEVVTERPITVPLYGADDKPVRTVPVTQQILVTGE